jgi:transposase
MEFQKFSQKYFCGVDLHSSSMYICIMDRQGDILVHRDMPNAPQKFLAIIKPYQSDLAVGVESTFNWYWLSDLCRKHQVHFALGHALYMKAIHGGKVKNDRIDSKTIAELMRTGVYPPAYAYPEHMRSTRDLLRRRNKFVSQRAELYRHISLMFYQHGLTPPTLHFIKKKAERHQVLDHFTDIDLRLSLQTDLNMIDTLDVNIATMEKQIFAQAKNHDRKSFNTLMSVPGCGEYSSYNILYETHDLNRFERVQNYASYCRVVKCQHQSGKTTKSGGNNKIGNPYLKFAMNEIAVHSINFSPRIKEYYQKKLLRRFSPGKAKAVLAHKFCIAIYYMLKGGRVFDEARFVNN